jgi:hypothetical protein
MSKPRKEVDIKAALAKFTTDELVEIAFAGIVLQHKTGIKLFKVDGGESSTDVLEAAHKRARKRAQGRR